MAKGGNQPDPENCKKYGVPFYGAAWVPYKHLRVNDSESKQKSSGDLSSSKDGESTAEPLPATAEKSGYIVLAGGGGEGRSGIPNAIVLAHFDFASRSLSNQPVFKLGLGTELPYRMTVHPGGHGLVCAFEECCRLYEWNEMDNAEVHKFGLKEPGEVLTHLEHVGQQLALIFNDEGSVLATGGEDGNLRVFKWPSMDIIICEAQAHGAIKDLAFSKDGKYLVSLGKAGPGRVWDVTSSKAAASLAKENDEIFANCRFSQLHDREILYIAAVTDRGTSILTWDTNLWRRMVSKHIVRDSVAAFNVSADGKLLAIGTSQGDVMIINSISLRVNMTVKKAHLGFVTALSFSDDSRALVSASMDSSARVTIIEDKKESGLSLWVTVFIIIIAIAVYLMKNKVFLEALL